MDKFALGLIIGIAIGHFGPVLKAKIQTWIKPKKKTEHAPGSRQNPHIISTAPNSFFWSSDIEPKTLAMATAWRQNNVNGNSDWVMIFLEPETFSKIHQRSYGSHKSLKFVFNEDFHIVYKCHATSDQEKSDWQREIKERI